MYQKKKSDEGDIARTFYRAGGINEKKLEKMKKKQKSQFISLLGFISTTTNIEIAKGYARKQQISKGSTRVLFEISIKPKEPCTAFAYIDGISFHPEEEEVLFSMGSAFVVDDIVDPPDGENFHTIKLIASEIDKTLIDDIRTKVEDCSPSGRAVLLAQCLIELGEYRAARKYLNSLLTQSYDGGILMNDPNLATIHSCLGTTYARQGLHGDALKAYKQALNAQARLEYSNNNALSNIHNNIGLAYVGLGHLDEAEKTLEKAVRIQQRELNSNQQHLASIYGNIGYVHYKKRNYNNALEAFGKAEKIYKQSSSKIAHDELEQSLMKAEYLTNYGHLLSTCKPLADAQDRYSDALKLYKSILPDGDPKLMQTHINIMLAYARNGNFKEVTNWFEDSTVQKLIEKQEINMFELNSSVTQADLAFLHKLVGACYAMQSSFGQAIHLWTRTIVFKPQRHIDQYQYREALDFYKHALEVQTLNLTSDHPGIKKICYAIGDIYCKLDKLSNAMEKYDVAENNSSNEDSENVAQQEKMNSEDSIEIFIARISMHRHLAELYGKKQAYEEAISEMDKSINLLKEELPSSTFEVSDETILIQKHMDESMFIISLQQLAKCYLHLGDILGSAQDDQCGYIGALNIYKKLFEYDKELAKDKLVLIFNKLSRYFEDTEEDEDALEYLQATVELEQPTIATLYRLGNLNVACEELDEAMKNYKDILSHGSISKQKQLKQIIQKKLDKVKEAKKSQRRNSTSSIESDERSSNGIVSNSPNKLSRSTTIVSAISHRQSEVDPDLNANNKACVDDFSDYRNMAAAYRVLGDFNMSIKYYEKDIERCQCRLKISEILEVCQPVLPSHDFIRIQLNIAAMYRDNNIDDVEDVDGDSDTSNESRMIAFNLYKKLLETNDGDVLTKGYVRHVSLIKCTFD
ncbi:unnamed protein product [Rotaria sp. Silwood1]|nr:unnamed protein product [Rotaria sp. Silwood1]